LYFSLFFLLLFFLFRERFSFFQERKGFSYSVELEIQFTDCVTRSLSLAR